MRRDSFWPRRRAFLSSLPEAEKVRLSGLSSRLRDDAAGERPGSERGDAEEALFMASLSASDRAYLEGGKGLGNSQKAEVAWLEREGILYEEVDVRDFAEGPIMVPLSSSRKIDQRRPQKAGQMHKQKPESEEIRLLLDKITALGKEHREELIFDFDTSVHDFRSWFVQDVLLPAVENPFMLQLSPDAEGTGAGRLEWRGAGNH